MAAACLDRRPQSQLFLLRLTSWNHRSCASPHIASFDIHHCPQIVEVQLRLLPAGKLRGNSIQPLVGPVSNADEHLQIQFPSAVKGTPTDPRVASTCLFQPSLPDFCTEQSFAGDMRVVVDEPNEHGLKKPPFSSPNGEEQTPTLGHHQIFRSGDPLAETINRAPDQDLSQHRKILELYADGDGFPENLQLKTIACLEAGKGRLLSVLVPHIRDLIAESSGTLCAENHSDSMDPFLLPDTGCAQQHSLQISLPDRKKRGRPHPFHASGKRLKSSPTCLMTTSTSSAETTPTEMDVEFASDETGDGLGHSSSDSDEGEPVLEKETQALRLDDTAGFTEFYVKAFTHLSQVLLRNILKAWIKLKEPGKQVKHPYNGGKNVSKDPENPGKLTAPDWWCNQDDWKLGVGSRHREPDHLNRHERLYLSPILLRTTSSYAEGNFTVDRLRGATDLLRMTPGQAKLLAEVYRVREYEQQYDDEEADGNTVIYIHKSNAQRRRRKNKSSKKAGKKRRVKDERRDTPRLSAKPTPAQKASDTEGVRSPNSPAFSSVTVKGEQEPLSSEYAGTTRDTLPTYGATATSEDMFNAMTLDATAEFRDIVAPHRLLRPSGENVDPLDPLSFFQPMRARNDGPLGEASSFPMLIDGQISELPIRNNYTHSDYRRPASGLGHSSSSYTKDWPPRTSQYDFNEDQILNQFRQPRGSYGRPPNPPPIPFGAPNDHPHGLPSYIQGPLCAQHNCPNSHTHGWRSFEQQQQVCSSKCCHEDPASHPMVWRRPEQQSPIQQSPYSSNSNGFPAPSPSAFDVADVTKSFP
ncbi:MAG: hypothetical protein Q9170_002760 [Blastenia crenularia]